MKLIRPVLLAVSMALAGPAFSQHSTETVAFSIEKKRLPEALAQWAQVTGMQVISQAAVIRHLTANPVIGSYTPMQALQLLLADSPLTFETIGDRTVSIEPIRQNATMQSTGLPLQRLAAVMPASSESMRESSPVTESGASGRTDFARMVEEEVIVTAQKRSERLQDVPVPVTALDAGALVDTNQLKLQDYYAQVPGLNYSMDNRGAPAMAIRGVTTGAFVSPTTGVTIDDVPFGSTVVVSSFSPAPDVDVSEVQRVEVLRGPQGTLYGASSMGGLIKYVTVDPSTERLNAHFQSGVSSIRNGDGVGYNVSAAVNIPVSDTFALRASGFTRDDPGYIDNVVTSEEGVNEVSVQGGRLSALWAPTDSVSVKLNAFLQRSQLDGSAQMDSNLADLENGFLKGTGGYERRVQAYSATASAKMGIVDFTSLTGYGRSTSSDSYDVSSALGFAALNFYGVGGIAWADQNNETTKVSQEFRFAMSLGERLEWRFGLFYTDERAKPTGGYVLIDPETYVRGAQIFEQRIRSTYEEYAAFTDFTLRVTDRFDVQFGGRQSHNEQTSITSTFGTAPLFGDASQPRARSSDESFTYLLTPRFRFTPDFMVYARLASGYRPGGPNIAAFVGGLPTSFEPDKTQNYEIGSKGIFLDQRLTVDASVYLIRWRDIQLGQIDSAFNSYTDNGGRARSRGVELSLDAKPFAGTSISTWAVWNDAELTEPAPDSSTAITAQGDRLPYSSKFSANLSVRQRIEINGDVTASFGGAVTYVGDRVGEFPSVFAGSAQRQRYPSYTRTDLNAGLSYQDWMANFYVNNVTDKRGLLGGGIGVVPPFAFNYIQPRTIGLSVSRSF